MRHMVSYSSTSPAASHLNLGFLAHSVPGAILLVLVTLGLGAEASGVCQINADGTARCDATHVQSMAGREVFYRVGANTGPGYNAATRQHAAVVLFQGTSPDICQSFLPWPFNTCSDDRTGGSVGPGSTWDVDLPLSASYGMWYQVATVVALVNAGYTVIQPAAHQQCLAPPLELYPTCAGYFWDTNTPNLPGLHAWNGSLDQQLSQSLVGAIQPGHTTFGSVDINHVYATGISSGGYMTSRMANELAGGLNPDGSVVDTQRPFRAVAIADGSFESCSSWFQVQQVGPFSLVDACTVPSPLPSASHAPTTFMHDPQDLVVPYPTMLEYLDQLRSQWPQGSAAYTVNGVAEPFTEEHDFSGSAPPFLHHQWDSNLTPDLNNIVLDWFKRHR